mmetsp:Transcript_33971/g.78325  ORF Transcript_33971/g.78325 Transcript_33971/m.78325 type:complete len:210 (+) Transcript_33971:222-851(+)
MKKVAKDEGERHLFASPPAREIPVHEVQPGSEDHLPPAPRVPELTNGNTAGGAPVWTRPVLVRRVVDADPTASALDYDSVPLDTEEQALSSSAFQWPTPQSLICPITDEVMNDPVVALDGHSYERVAIKQFLGSCMANGQSPRSPVTGEVLSMCLLIPNVAIRSQCRDYKEKVAARLYVWRVLMLWSVVSVGSVVLLLGLSFLFPSLLS